MNQNDIYVIQKSRIQANIFTMMAISDPGLILAIMVNIFSSVILTEYQYPLYPHSWNGTAPTRTWSRGRKGKH